jgi:hypothetical protein
MVIEHALILDTIIVIETQQIKHETVTWLIIGDANG